MDKTRTVMTFSGHDPCGGAGLQADIEALASQGCHTTPVITALTVQNTHDIVAFKPVDADHVMAQARAVLEDIPVGIFKIGLTGSVENVQAIHTLLQAYPDIPVVLDPVLATGAGTQLGEPGLPEAISQLLLPHATVATPNSVETRQLAPAAETLDAAAIALLERGAEFVLVTGTHVDTPTVINTLYQGHAQLESFTWERLPHSYHGSGCTLAATIAGMLAHGLDPFQACLEAQEYTWNTLKNGHRPGQGQYLSNRLFWSGEER